MGMEAGRMSKKDDDFFKIAAVPGPLLHEYIAALREHQLMSDAIREICESNNLDPEKSTVGDFMKLGRPNNG
jgi:hypothetical protein